MVKEGASITEIDSKFQDQIEKGYIVKINLTREDINQKFFSGQSLYSNFCISVTFETRAVFYKSHLLNDRLKVIARNFISKQKEGGKSKDAERHRERVCERQTVAAKRHSIGNKIGG